MREHCGFDFVYHIIDNKMMFKIFCRYDMIYMCIEIIISFKKNPLRVGMKTSGDFYFQ